MSKNTPRKNTPNTEVDQPTDAPTEQTDSIVEVTPPLGGSNNTVILDETEVAPKPRTVTLKQDVLDGASPKDRVIYALNEYKSMMALNKVQDTKSSAEGAFKLYEAITNLLKTPAELYQQTMSGVVSFIRDNRHDVFNDKYIFRGFLALHGRFGVNRTDLVTEVLSSLLTLADTTSVAEAKKRVSVNQIAARFTNQNEADKYLSYFK